MDGESCYFLEEVEGKDNLRCRIKYEISLIMPNRDSKCVGVFFEEKGADYKPKFSESCSRECDTYIPRDKILEGSSEEVKAKKRIAEDLVTNIKNAFFKIKQLSE